MIKIILENERARDQAVMYTVCTTENGFIDYNRTNNYYSCIERSNNLKIKESYI